MTRVVVFHSRPRMWLGVIALWLASTFAAVAGHDYVASFAIHGPENGVLGETEVPVSFGAPVPLWVELKDLRRLTLVGSVASQLSVADRWPSGDVRWIHVDALIQFPSGASRTAAHLTTGTVGRPTADVLIEKPDGAIEFSVGQTRFTARTDRGVRVVVASPSGEEFSAWALRLSGAEDTASSAMRVRRNGPVVGVLELTQQWKSGPKESLWIHVIRGAREIEIEHCFYVPPSEAESNVVIGGGVELGALSGWSPESRRLDAAQTILKRRTSSDPLSLVFESSAWKEIRQGDRMSLKADAPQMRAGAWTRRRLALSIADTPEISRSQRAIAAKALSLDTYNDALVSTDAVYPAEVYPGDVASGPFTGFRWDIYKGLTSTEPDPAQWRNLRSKLDRILAEGGLSRGLPGETLTLWSRLTGDSAVADLYHDWSAWFLGSFENIESAPFGAVKTAGQCLDLVAALESRLARERLTHWLRRLNQRLQSDEAELREFAREQGASLLSVLGRTSRFFAGVEPLESDALDLLETLVRWSREAEPNDRVWIEGYYTTGDPDYLRNAADAVGAGAGVGSTLRYLVAQPNRFSVWKDLEIEKARKRKGVIELSWTPPARSQRARLKVFGDEARTDGALVFARGREVSLGEPLGPPERVQTVSIDSENVVAPKFLARYLERGSALPALKRESPAATTAPSIANTIDLMILIAVSAFALLICIILWKRFFGA